VLLASSLIPGNESAIYGIINKLTDLGANVVHKGNARVHVSGHASAGELVYCYNILRPRNVMPVHGEPKHLHANGTLAERTGVAADQVLITRDGVVVDLVDGVARIVGQVDADLVYVDGQTVGHVTEDTLAERRKLSSAGVVTVLLSLEPGTTTLAEPPEYLLRGLVHNQEGLDDATRAVEKALADAGSRHIADVTKLEELISTAVARTLARRSRREPVVIVITLDAS
jgi:ribonuclease J